MNILDLNVDCLLVVFKYLDSRALRNVCLASEHLCAIIEREIFYYQSLDLLMCGHRNTPHIMARTNTTMSHWERLRVSENWRAGRYWELEFFKHLRIFPTKMHLEHDHLYLTHTNCIRRYKRSPNEALHSQLPCEIGRQNKSDITDFVKKSDTIFAGRTCGRCFIYDCDGDVRTDQRLHTVKEYLNCVDFGGDIYVSSSNRCTKVWRRAEEFGLVHLDVAQVLSQSYKSLKLTADRAKIYGCLDTDKHHRALREIVLETATELVLNSPTTSVHDIKLKDDNVLFTANFDATFRMYDRRTDRDECVWQDPFDKSFICLDYDGLYGVLAGTKHYGRVNLYDIRVPAKYAQLYFPKSDREVVSPVYSVCCDSRFLFFATNHNLHVMDFKEGYGYQNDYRHISDKTYPI